MDEALHQAAALPKTLSLIQRFQTRVFLERVATELVDPSVEVHWWESYLDLVAGFARGFGAPGESLAGAVARLLPLARVYMRSHDPAGSFDPTGPYTEVSLRPVTQDTVWGICSLSDTLTEPKKSMVAPNAVSMAEAHFNQYAWFRAIYAGKAPVGFMMIVDDDQRPEYFLWRFMLGQPFHGRGYGRQAIARLVEYVRTRPGARELLVSCEVEEGSPEGFYRKLGFERTGAWEGQEAVMRLPLE
jgi:diamine N-acetyltransferase